LKATTGQKYGCPNGLEGFGLCTNTGALRRMSKGILENIARMKQGVLLVPAKRINRIKI